MAGIERTVALGLMSYVDENGSHRHAQLGATVQVHPDHVDSFDRLNVLQGQAPAVEPVAPLVVEPEPEPEPAPKSRTRTRKED